MWHTVRKGLGFRVCWNDLSKYLRREPLCRSSGGWEQVVLRCTDVCDVITTHEAWRSAESLLPTTLSPKPYKPEAKDLMESKP